MRKLELSSSFTIGHSEIDEQHTEIVVILNDLADGYMSKDIDLCRKKWKLLCEKLVMHFIYEEKVMTDLGFDIDSHEHHHGEIIRYITVLGKKNKTIDDWGKCLIDIEHKILVQILKYDLYFAEYLVGIGYINNK